MHAMLCLIPKCALKAFATYRPSHVADYQHPDPNSTAEQDLRLELASSQPPRAILEMDLPPVRVCELRQEVSILLLAGAHREPQVAIARHKDGETFPIGARMRAHNAVMEGRCRVVAPSRRRWRRRRNRWRRGRSDHRSGREARLDRHIVRTGLRQCNSRRLGPCRGAWHRRCTYFHQRNGRRLGDRTLLCGHALRAPQAPASAQACARGAYQHAAVCDADLLAGVHDQLVGEQSNCAPGNKNLAKTTLNKNPTGLLEEVLHCLRTALVGGEELVLTRLWECVSDLLRLESNMRTTNKSAQ